MNENLELYKIFYTVAVCENISKASEALYISQPAVSKAIKKLEKNTGISLFSRNSRGVKLTEEGTVLFQYVKNAMEQLTLGENVLNKLRNMEQGSIKIGVSSILCKIFLIPVLKKFIQKYPNIQIKIIIKTTVETLELAREGKIDFGIVSEPLQNDEYNFIKLLEIHDIFVASREYLDSLKLKEPSDIFTNSDIMILEECNISRKYIDKYFAENNISVKPYVEISNMDLLIEFAKIGLGTACVIENFVIDELSSASLIKIDVKPEIPQRNIGIVYNKNIPLSISAQTYVNFLKDAYIH